MFLFSLVFSQMLMKIDRLIERVPDTTAAHGSEKLKKCFGYFKYDLSGSCFGLKRISFQLSQSVKKSGSIRLLYINLIPKFY